jgi:replicative DNA helicase
MTDVLSPQVGRAAEGLVPPQAIDAEHAVLGALLLDSEAVGRAIERLNGREFYRDAHRKIFQAIVGLFNRGERADLVTVTEELRRRGDLETVGGPAYVAQLLDHGTTSANLEHHCRLIYEKSLLRELIRAADQVKQECYAQSDETHDILDRAEQRIFAIADTRVRTGFITLRELLKPTFDHIQKLFDRKVHVTGVPSGFDDLDALTAGFQPGDLIVIGGRPSMGKTSFALNIAENAAIRHQIPVAVFSLEMSAQQLALRLLCSQSGVNLHRVRTGHLSDRDWPDLTTGAGLLSQAPIAIDDSAALSVLEIRAKARRLKSEGRLGLIIIDYLQLLRPVTAMDNRVLEIGQMTRALKALAKELDVPVIVLSQLSRAVEVRSSGGRPQLSDLRESGSVEQDSDVVLFVYREVVYKPDTAEPGKAVILVAKQRNGPTGDVPLTFLREQTRFVPYSPIQPDEEPRYTGGAPF